MSKVVSIAIGKRDRRHLEKWAAQAKITPEEMLGRILMQERIRRKTGAGMPVGQWPEHWLDQDQGP